MGFLQSNKNHSQLVLTGRDFHPLVLRVNYDRTTSEIRGPSLKIISEDSRRARHAVTVPGHGPCTRRGASLSGSTEHHRRQGLRHLQGPSYMPLHRSLERESSSGVLTGVELDSVVVLGIEERNDRKNVGDGVLLLHKQEETISNADTWSMMSGTAGRSSPVMAGGGCMIRRGKCGKRGKVSSGRLPL
jgi:hypothetical protein